MTIYVYDLATDRDRPITQSDADKLQRTAHAFAELVKKTQFYLAEVRNGLILPGRAVSEIERALREAQNTAETLEELAKVQTGTRNVLVIER